MLALGGRARRGVHTVITVAAVAAAAVAVTAAPATAAPAARQSVGPGPTAVFSWGWNQHGEVGDGTTNHRATPGPVLGLPSGHGLQVAVKQLASAEDSEACAVLLADGTVYTWGFNAYGELGDGTTTERLTPVLVPGLTGITQLAAGDIHSLALRSDGTVLSWGRNDYGELGTGTTVSRPTPAAGRDRPGRLPGTNARGPLKGTKPRS